MRCATVSSWSARWASSSPRAVAGLRRLAASAAAEEGGAAPAGRVALVQGSNRGLGLEFARQLLARPDTSVVATCRTPSAAEQLQALQREHAPGRLLVLQLDSTDEGSIAQAAEQVRAPTIVRYCWSWRRRMC